MQGEVIRFDPVKGYGFISPRNGGEDVFLHANDLLDEKYLVRTGTVVEFAVEAGERGLKASSVHVVSPGPVEVPAAPRQAAATPPATSARTADARTADAPPADASEELVDVLPEPEFLHELTELLLRVEPGLTGPQVLATRTALLAMGRRFGWIGN